MVPVLVGVAAAGHVIAWRLIAALLVAAGLQIGVNFANDYFDGVRGVDTAERIGPPRLVASGAASPRAVLTASLLSLGLAGACGLALALATTPVLVLVVGALALVAALLYSGGPRPYAGMGLGELMVFLFFGLMATCGSAYVMVETVPAAAWWSGVVMGLLAVAVLVANNLRDIPTDEAGGKRTLAVGWATDGRGRSTARASSARSRRSCSACVVFIVDESIGTDPMGAVRVDRVAARDPTAGAHPCGDRPRPDPRADGDGRVARSVRHLARARARTVARGLRGADACR